jgi:hypothetical protein
MTQQILMIWLATAVAAFTGLVGCTTKDTARQPTTKAQRDLDPARSLLAAGVTRSIQDFNAAHARNAARVER